MDPLPLREEAGHPSKESRLAAPDPYAAVCRRGIPQGRMSVRKREDGGVESAAASFIDHTLRSEASEWRTWADGDPSVGGLGVYGASVGAIRGTVRDALRRYRDLQHDDITALASELWATPVFERRLAAIVLLQRQVDKLRGNDLTRIEGVLRDARIPQLIEPLTLDVVRLLLDRLSGTEADRARRIVARWAESDADSLRAAAALL